MVHLLQHCNTEKRCTNTVLEATPPGGDVPKPSNRTRQNSTKLITKKQFTNIVLEGTPSKKDAPKPYNRTPQNPTKPMTHIPTAS